MNNPPNTPLKKLNKSYTKIKLNYFNSSSLTITILNNSNLTFILKKHLQKITNIRKHDPQSPS